MYDILFFAIVILIGFVSGTIIERRHFKSINKREKGLVNQPIITFGKNQSDNFLVERSELVSESIVVSIDAFKKLVAGIINIFGGNVISYESLLDRARREVILRIKEKNPQADQIINLRIETSSISKGKKKTLGAVEVLAYGTAVYKR